MSGVGSRGCADESVHAEMWTGPETGVYRDAGGNSKASCCPSPGWVRNQYPTPEAGGLYATRSHHLIQPLGLFVSQATVDQPIWTCPSKGSCSVEAWRLRSPTRNGCHQIFDVDGSTADCRSDGDGQAGKVGLNSGHSSYPYFSGVFRAQLADSFYAEQKGHHRRRWGQYCRCHYGPPFGHCSWSIS